MRQINPGFVLLCALPVVVSRLSAQAPASGLQGRPPGLHVVEPDEQERELRMTPVVRAVQKAADSVVSIYLNHALGLAGGRQVTEGQGSGVILDESGFVITNWHVVAIAIGNEQYSVAARLKDGRTIAARIVSSSPNHDLALLQLQLGDGETVRPVALGRSADLMIGETLIAIGNPQGHANTVTSGVLSAIGRSIQVQAPDRQVREYTGLLQTDAAINQGNSGGALLDITGKLIGINNAMAMGAENIGFAIPVDTMREVFENDLLGSGSLSAIDAWFGMEIGFAADRVVVDSVVAGGPAERAGVRAGDVLASAGEREIRSKLDWTRRLLDAKVDRPLPLRLLRDGRTIEAAPRPMTRTAGLIFGSTGLLVEGVRYDVDRDLAASVTRKFYENSGLYRLTLFNEVLRVREVQPDSPGAALQVAAGDVLMAYEMTDQFGRRRDLRLDSTAVLAELLRKAQGGTLEIVLLRDGRELQGPLDVRRIDAR